MSKLFKKIIVLIAIMLLVIGVKVYAATPTLADIANKFNNSSIVETYASAGGSVVATSDADSLNIKTDVGGQVEDIEFLLEGNILYIEIDQADEAAIGKAYMAQHVTDIIGQLHGYAEGEVLTTINSDEVTNYTVANEGFELENISETKVKIKNDITKKIPLIDVSDKYIEVSDLEELKEFIAGDGTAEKSKGNVWFNKSGNNGENTLLVAEKNELTENSYNSILSIIEVMFDSSKAVDYFKTNYPGISNEDKEFTGFKIEINPIKTEFEEELIPSDSGYKFARITINKSLVNSVIEGVAEENEEVLDFEEMEDLDIDNEEQQTSEKQNSEELPKTGINLIFQGVIFVLIALVVIISYKQYNNCIEKK